MRFRGNHRDRWMISYADFVTILFAAFVLLYASARPKETDSVSRSRQAGSGSRSRHADSSPASSNLDRAPPDSVARAGQWFVTILDRASRHHDYAERERLLQAGQS